MRFVRDTGFDPGWVAIPTSSSPRFNQFWDSMEMLEVPEKSGYTRVEGPSIALNRNNAIRAMLHYDFGKWIAFFDDDHEFPADILLVMLKRMKEHPEIDVLFAPYVKRVPPFSPVVFKTVEMVSPTVRKGTSFTWAEMAEAMEQNDGLLEVEATGGSGLLIRRETIDKMKPGPWFTVGQDQEDSSGDDVEFCQNVKKAGMRVFADLKVPLGHTTPVTIIPEYADGKWSLKFKFGPRGFALEAQKFHP